MHIPDNSEDIHDLAGHIRKEAAKYHNYNPGWKFGTWLQGLFGGWGGTILRFLLTGLAVLLGIFIILSVIKAAIMAGLRKCVTGWHPKTTLKKPEAKPEEMARLARKGERDTSINGTIFPGSPQPLVQPPSLRLLPIYHLSVICVLRCAEYL